MTDAVPELRKKQGAQVRPRVPFGGHSYKLEVANKDPNFYYYWQKDVGDNLQRMIEAGYEFVTRRQAGKELPEQLTNRDVHGSTSLDDRMTVHGGWDQFGKPYNLFLMRLPMELHQQDQALHDAKVDEIDQSIKRQAFGGQKVENSYGSIEVSRKETL